jgi:hypothetical protein
MLRRITFALVATLVGLAALGTSAASAARNPSGTGQVVAECGDDNDLNSPPGFITGGFAKAEIHYAGSDATPSLNAHSPHAVAIRRRMLSGEPAAQLVPGC